MKRIIVIVVAASLTACATTAAYRPVIDTHGVDATAFDRDLAECKQFAAQRDPARQTMAGAIAGALLGALVGGVVGGNDYVGYGAASGATAGAAGGAAGGADAQYQIVDRCLTGRGYRVLAR